jgi:hypothetical protein
MPQPVAWSAMAALLDSLDKLAAQYPELLDTDVRERMWHVVEQQLIKQETDIQILPDLGMFSEEANHQLQTLLHKHLTLLKGVFKAFRLDDESKRLMSFHNPKLVSSEGHHVDYFFGSPE